MTCSGHRPGEPCVLPEDCARCGTPVDPLALFPGGVCLECWKQTPEGRRMPTADEVVRAWGGPARRR